VALIDYNSGVRRRMLNFATAVSLLLLAVAVALYVKSFSHFPTYFGTRVTSSQFPRAISVFIELAQSTAISS